MEETLPTNEKTDHHENATTFRSTCSLRPALPWGLGFTLPGGRRSERFRGTNHGTLINGATFAAGRSGQAFAFDGTDDFVQVADDATLDISPTITIAAWVSPDSEGASDGTTGILWKGDSIASPTGQSYVFLWTNSEVSFRLGSGSTLYETAYVPLPLNTFSHIAGTFDGSQMNLYVNGNLKTFTTTVPASINDSSGDLLIGTTTTSGGGLGGDPTRFFSMA